MADDGFSLELGLIAMLILLNGFFAGAEIAVISARRGRIRPLAEAGDRRAATLLRLKSDPDRFLATVQIGITLVGTLASAVGGVAAVERLEPFFAGIPSPWAATLAEPLAVGIVVFSIAYLSLVVGELIPKSLAVRHAESLALRVARPIDWLSRASRPAVTVLTASSRLGLRLLRQKKDSHSPFHTLDDIRAIVEEAEEQGVIEGGVLSGAVEFHDREVREVMTPRPRLAALPRTASIEEARRLAAQSGHTRFPVFESEPDDLVGVLHARDLYAVGEDPSPPDIASLVRPVIFVPVTKKARELLSEMRQAERHMAFAVDEHGTTVGIVTLEDLLEVIVGEIPDEHRAAEPPLKVLGPGLLEAAGSVALHVLNEREDVKLPESTRYMTLAGLILDRLGSLPEVGQVVDVPPHRLSVTAVEGHRVARVRIETGAERPARPQEAGSGIPPPGSARGMGRL